MKLATILIRLFFGLIGVFLMGYGWIEHDLRYEVLGAAIVVDGNLSAGIARLREDLGLRK